MALPRLRYVGYTTFRLPDGHEIFVTNKSVILSGPEEWLAPIGLASVAAAMRESQDPVRELYGEDRDPTGRLYVSTDSPDRFDAKYPGNLLGVWLERSSEIALIGIGVGIERDDPAEPDADLRRELGDILDPLFDRHGAANFATTRNRDAPELVSVHFEISTRGKTIGDALSIGREAKALLEAARGGSLTLETATDLVRSGHAAVLIGQPEGPWFDGKGAPYQLATDADKWELAKDVGAFANASAGGLILLGARTRKGQNGDVVQSISSFELSMFSPSRYRNIVTRRLHPAVEGLEVRAVPITAARGVGYIYIPPQREESKPFVLAGVVVASRHRATHVSIPERDGEDTRFADATEVRSLLQAGRIALRQP